MTCASRMAALTLVAALALPTLAMTAGCSRKNNAPTETNGGHRQKGARLTGAALLFYLYKRYQSQDMAVAQAGQNTPPPLEREDKGPNKGAIFYHDANHKIVWLQASAQGIQVPADQVQRYLPDYNADPGAYQGQVNTSPQPLNGTVQPADQYAGANR